MVGFRKDGSLIDLFKTIPKDWRWEERNVYYEDPTGAYTIEEVRTQWDYELEGWFLAHCLGTKNATEFNEAHRVFSVRDRLGFPHATVLLQRDLRWSPYGVCADLFTENEMYLDDESYWVLQVRGRNDDIARYEYYELVARWYELHGGVMEHDLSDIRNYLVQRGDSDLKYHYSYKMDVRNPFTFSYNNSPLVDRFRAAGLSL